MKIDKLVNGPLARPLITAFATEPPTPDCNGSKFSGKRPPLISSWKKSIKVLAHCFRIIIDRARGLVVSGMSQGTIATIFQGRKELHQYQCDHPGVSNGIGLRYGGSRRLVDIMHTYQGKWFGIRLLLR